MISEKSLVIYKNRPALVSSIEGEKLNITVFAQGAGESFKVREKDLELLHPGPCSPADLEEAAPPEDRQANAKEAWELLLSDAADVPLKELAELLYGAFSPRSALAAWALLREGLYFTGDSKAIRARPRETVEGEQKKRDEKERESGDRAAFLEKLKKLPPFKVWETKGNSAIELSEAERRFLQDVEALARGQSDKSRTVKELGRSETPEEAQRLLLDCGAWTPWENPHPGRFGLGRDSAKIVPPPAPDEERRDLRGLAAYAIDSPWSDDPDDAVSLEGPDEQGRCFLWVHVADPAAAVLSGSPADREALGRGATLYIPEGPCRMLSPEALPVYALDGESPALSFKMTLKPDLSIEETEIIPSVVKVTRLSYQEADALIARGLAGSGETLCALLALAERNIERRLDLGAVIIELPEVHIHVDLEGERQISLEPVPLYRSAELVRECMLWAGEGAARWAIQKKLPFPFVSQEAGELPERRLTGFAGAWQLRRCMRPRLLSAKPGIHWGLGLDEYTQVTSPLRRYTDLLCHQQIRAQLRGEKPLSEEEILLKIGAAEAAGAAVSRAERASRSHWTVVYLSDKKDSRWEGVLVDRKGNKGTVIIPALGLETQLSLRGNEEPNDKLALSLVSLKIPETEAVFSIC